MSELKPHDGNPQDDYNKIQNGNYPYSKLLEEAAYVLEEDADNLGTFAVSKKPEDATIEQVTDVWGFIADKEKVLIVMANGTFNRYNFDIASYYMNDGE
jgi:hypothetical protein